MGMYTLLYFTEYKSHHCSEQHCHFISHNELFGAYVSRTLHFANKI